MCACVHVRMRACVHVSSACPHLVAPPEALAVGVNKALLANAVVLAVEPGVRPEPVLVAAYTTSVPDIWYRARSSYRVADSGLHLTQLVARGHARPVRVWHRPRVAHARVVDLPAPYRPPSVPDPAQYC